MEMSCSGSTCYLCSGKLGVRHTHSGKLTEDVKIFLEAESEVDVKMLKDVFAEHVVQILGSVC